MARFHRTVGTAALSAIVGTLPVFLLGGLSVLIREDLALDASRLGAAVSCFFVVAALSAIPAGRFTHRFGEMTLTVGAGLTALGLCVLALAGGYRSIVIGAIVAGAGNSFAQVGSNDSLARTVVRERQGLAFGIKQAAVPAAALVAGLALPILAPTRSWRLGFAAAAVVAIGQLIFSRSTNSICQAARPADRGEEPDVTRRTLIVIAVAGAIGAGMANATGAFLVVSAVTSGIVPGQAGLLMAIGSVIGVAGRVVVGRRADQRGRRHLPAVAALLAVAALGTGLLATGYVPALIAGSALALGIGWSWPGLLNLAVARLRPSEPSVATSYNQTGAFVGAAIGPITFSVMTSNWSFPVAWWVGCAALLGAAALMMLGRRLALVDRAGD